MSFSSDVKEELKAQVSLKQGIAVLLNLLLCLLWQDK